MEFDPVIPMALPFSDPNATLDLVGGKGALLAQITQAGLPVPGGFCVTTESYRRFLEENGLQDRMLHAISSASLERMETIAEASSDIERWFADGVMPVEVVRSVRGLYAGLGGETVAVAVRSSASIEDLPGFSSAGQLETFLNVQGETELLEAIKRCWASLWSERAIGYRWKHRIPSDGLGMAVVVQVLVPADASGVLFTADPVTGERNRILIDASWGLGSASTEAKVRSRSIRMDEGAGESQ